MIIAPQEESVFTYTRTYESPHMLVMLNFTSENVLFMLPDDVDQHQV
jgi:hypothetical protein